LKSLVKYQLVLLITLVVGYSQLFAPLSRIYSTGPLTDSEELKAESNGISCGDVLYFEEDRDSDERLSRKQFELSDYFAFYHSAAWEFATNPIIAFSSKCFDISPASGHTVFFALRL
jgi:hypothetical protein